MPYITRTRRNTTWFAARTVTREAMLREKPSTGDLNYLISSLVDDYLTAQPTRSYENMNAAIGVLECAKAELYRRVAAPYEDEKLAINGDVFNPDN